MEGSSSQDGTTQDNTDLVLSKLLLLQVRIEFPGESKVTQGSDELTIPGVVAPNLLPCQDDAASHVRAQVGDSKTNLKAACSKRWVRCVAPSGAIHALFLAHARRGCSTCQGQD
eukprot:767584-Hanusia_phi.AAC.3